MTLKRIFFSTIMALLAFFLTGMFIEIFFEIIIAFANQLFKRHRIHKKNLFPLMKKKKNCLINI